jgi:hypothetical protein
MPAASAASTSHLRWLIVVLILVVALMVGGGLSARELYRLPVSLPAGEVSAPSSTALSPSEQPGPDTVQLTQDAALHPQHEIVRALLQNYFNAINRRDYSAWTSTVTQDRVRQKSQAAFLADYQTTKDGSILVYRIETLPMQDLRVFLAFTSTQDPSAAPLQLKAGCVRWNIVFPLTYEDGQYQVASVGPLAPTEVSRC